MAVTGVGSSFTYIYNTKTGKLSSKDGKEDDFIRYFNGDMKGEDSDTLNGFDRAKKSQIKNLVSWWQKGIFRGGMDSASEEQEISGKIVDAVTDEYYVNGQRALTAHSGMLYTPAEFPGLFQHQSYKTHQSRGYDPADNSIYFAVGDVFEIGNGYRLTVRDDTVEVEGYGRGSEEDDKKAGLLAGGMSALIAFADQLTFSEWISKESTPLLLDLLREQGVDTSKEFIINGTRCELRDGRIREVNSNRAGVPNSVYEQALKRYEEASMVRLADER